CSGSVNSPVPPSSSIDPPEGSKSPAISRNSDVLPEPLGPITASAWPEAASKSRPENTSRPPRTHLTSRPLSRILPRCGPSENLGVPHQNYWVVQCWRTIVGVAAHLERL